MTHCQKFFYTSILFCVLTFFFAPVQPVIAQETVPFSVTATIPAKPTDYQLSITATPRDSRQSQGVEIIYTITYGSRLDYITTPVTLEATIQPGRILGTTISSLYIAEYVNGSASNAYGVTAPIIDLVRHTITWNMPSLPAHTIDQTVSFRLLLNTSYTGKEVVDTDVAVKLITPDVILNDVMTESYQYKVTPPVVTPTIPTPSPTPTKLTIHSITLNSLTNTTADFSFQTSAPAKTTIFYTNTATEITQTQRNDTFSRYHAVSLTELTPNTPYTIQIRAEDRSGTKASTDALAIHTTPLYSPVHIDKRTFVVSSNDTIFFSTRDTPSIITQPVITLPINIEYAFQFTVAEPLRIARIQAVMRDTNVLGFSIDTLLRDLLPAEPEASTDMIDMTEIAPAIFSGKLKTKPYTGSYDMIARITDINGNITEEMLSTILVVHPFTVLRSDTKTPIEHARILLSRYDAKTDRFIPLSPTNSTARNPSYTTVQGEALFVLSNGVYTAQVNYEGASTTVRFNIDKNQHSGFPVVLLPRVPFSVFDRIKYFVQAILDVLLYQTVAYFSAIGSSLRLFDTTSALVLTILVIMTFVSFSSRTYIELRSIPRYVLRIVHSIVPNTSAPIYISGTVIDGSSRKPIAMADVSIMETETNTVVAQLHTDRSGHYFYRIHPTASYSIQAIKSGYEHLEPISYQPDISPHVFVHILHVAKTHTYSLVSRFQRAITFLFGWLFEGLIIASVIFEILFAQYGGLLKTLPYMLISILNLLLWISYLHHKKHLPSE